MTKRRVLIVLVLILLAALAAPVLADSLSFGLGVGDSADVLCPGRLSAKRVERGWLRIECNARPDR